MNEEKCERARGGIKSIHANACFGEVRKIEWGSGAVGRISRDEDTTRRKAKLGLKGIAVCG